MAKLTQKEVRAVLDGTPESVDGFFAAKSGRAKVHIKLMADDLEVGMCGEDGLSVAAVGIVDTGDVANVCNKCARLLRAELEGCIDNRKHAWHHTGIGTGHCIFCGKNYTDRV